MKNLMIISFLLISALSFGQVNFKGCATGTERVAPIDEELEKEILRLVNIERKKVGLADLKLSEQLSYSARYHAADMATENYFEHDSHDRKSENIVEVCGTFDRIEKFYTDGFACAENISAGRSTAQATVDGWMNSTGHKANILHESAKFIGIGYYSNPNSDYTHYCVQCFGY